MCVEFHKVKLPKFKTFNLDQKYRNYFNHTVLIYQCLLWISDHCVFFMPINLLSAPLTRSELGFGTKMRLNMDAQIIRMHKHFWTHHAFVLWPMLTCLGTIHILLQHIFGLLWAHPTTMSTKIQYWTSGKMPIFWTHPPSPYADVIYGWPVWLSLPSE